jgi:hypothetical protein
MPNPFGPREHDGTPIPVPPDLARIAGITLQVIITGHVSDVLEVAEDRQHLESWAGRLITLMQTVKGVVDIGNHEPIPVQFTCLDENGLPVSHQIMAVIDPHAHLVLWFEGDE